jgi:c-di-GMP-binding flagellar brake protein YcgR
MSDGFATDAPRDSGDELAALAGRFELSENVSERRRHRRVRLACPVWFIGEDGTTVLRCRTQDVSNSGALAILPTGSAPQIGQRVCLRMALPYETRDTYVLTSYEGHATVVRTCPSDQEDNAVGVGLQFEKAMDLEFAV